MTKGKFENVKLATKSNKRTIHFKPKSQITALNYRIHTEYTTTTSDLYSN